MKEITLFSPATVANVSCGFDTLGFCLDEVGDIMRIRQTTEIGLKISKIEGADLPLDPKKNVATVAAQALLDAYGKAVGFEMDIYKKIKPGSGIGSSSASASGAVWGINVLLGKPFSPKELTYFAMKGEAVASGSEHADNVAPGIFGGFTLVKSLSPFEVLSLPTPKDLYAVLLHPQIEIKTADSRGVLPKEIPLKTAVKQWANVGSLVHALHTEDYTLLASSLEDYVAEPYRSRLIPHFDAVKAVAQKQGALGTGISGSGPSIFSLCQSKENAEALVQAIASYYQSTGIPYHIFSSKINPNGVSEYSL